MPTFAGHMPHKIDIVTAPPVTAAVVRLDVEAAELPHIGDQIGAALEKVGVELGAAHVPPSGPPLAYYVPRGDRFDVAVGFPVPEDVDVPAGLDRLVVGGVQAAHTTHIGSYRGLSNAYADLLTQGDTPDRTPELGAPVWEVYCAPPGTPEEELRTEIYWAMTSSEPAAHPAP